MKRLYRELMEEEIARLRAAITARDIEISDLKCKLDPMKAIARAAEKKFSEAMTRDLLGLKAIVDMPADEKCQSP